MIVHRFGTRTLHPHDRLPLFAILAGNGAIAVAALVTALLH